MNLKATLWRELTALLGVAIIAAPANAAGPGAGINVNVVNPASNPVPVSVQGTSTISGSVNVTNTPNVSVTNTPNVSVVNQPTVLSADNPALQPVLVDVSIDLGVTGSFLFGQKFSVYTVPAGKRLVIEHVDAIAFLNDAGTTGNLMLQLGLVDSTGTVFSNHGIGATSQSAQCTLTQACIVFAQAVRIYVDPGSFVSASVSGTASPALSGSFVEVTINGHLVNL